MSSRTPCSHIVAILPVPTSGMILVRFRGPIHGIGTHWTKQGSRPCFGKTKCALCLHGADPLYKGFASVDEWRESCKAWYPMVLEITGCAEEVLREVVAPGQLWAFERVGDKDRRNKVVPHFVEESNVVLPEIPVFPVLRRMWMLQADPPEMLNNMTAATLAEPLVDAPADVLEILRKIGKAPPPRSKASARSEFGQLGKRVRTETSLPPTPSANGHVDS